MLEQSGIGDGDMPVVLLADDDAADRKAAMHALEMAGIGGQVHVVRDGEETLNYLFRRNEYSDPARSPRPDLMLLDLNMPRRTGLQVLKELRGVPELHRIPVVILAASNAEKEVARSYDLGCHSFVTKPVMVDEFIEAAERLIMSWFQQVRISAL